MAIKPNSEERSLGPDREQHRDISNGHGSAGRPSSGENVARADGAPESGTPRTRSNRGFASMDREKQREIASKGGRAAHQKGTAHEFDAGEARAAGRKGGVTVSRNKEHMAAIGRRGGEARGANRAARQQQMATPSDPHVNGSTSPSGNTGGQRIHADREVGLRGQTGQNANGADTRRTSGNSLGGESRNASPAESNIERL